MIFDRKYLNGGLSADAAEWAVEPNAYVNLENARFGSTFFADGSVGGIESIGSTELIASAQPSMQNYFLGGAYDEAGNRLVWCNWSSIGAHQIKVYDISTNTTYIAIYNTQIEGGLGFDKYHFIHSARVENGCFYWTDNLNPPRRFQIDAAIKMNYPSYTTEVVSYTSPLSQAVISWIRRPPGLPPIQSKVTQTSPVLVNNFIRYEAFQFCYRYQFRTFEYSTLSALSTLANYNTKEETFNRIDITIPIAEQIEQDILQVDLVIKYLVSGKYGIIKSWNKEVPADAAAIIAHNNGSMALTYAFYNGVAPIFLDDAYSVKPYDSVPLLAETIELARNRGFMGNYLLGYNSPGVTSLTASIVESDGSATVVFKTNASYQLATTFYDDNQRKCGYITTAAVLVNIPDRTYGTSDYVMAISWTLSNANAINEIPAFAHYYSIDITKCLRTRFFLQLRGADASYAVKDSNGNYTFTTRDYNPLLAGTAFDVSSLASASMGYVYSEGDIIKIYLLGNTTVYSLAITGQVGTWVIAELQDLGTLSANTSYLFEIYTPYQVQTNEPEYEVGSIYTVLNPGTNSRQYSTTSGLLTGDVYLLNRPDFNQYYYQIQPGSISTSFPQFHTVGCNFINYNSVETGITTGNSPLQDLSGYNPINNTTRFIQQNANATTIKVFGNLSVSVKNIDSLFPGAFTTDFSLYVEDNTGVNRWNLVSRPTLNVPAMGAGSVVVAAIFDTDVTLAAGARLFILAGVATSAHVEFTYSISDLTIQYPDVGSATTLVEAMSPNDKFYKNWFTDAGRPNFIDTIGQAAKMNGICYSNTIIEGSKSNGLSTFDALDTQDLDFQMGALQKLQLTSKVAEQGSVMLAICSKETASLYLGEVQVVAASTNAFLSSSPNVIGTINILKGSFGTTNPESVLEYKGLVVWLDANNGKVIQYGENGLFPISSYKVNKYWKLFSETYLSLTPQQIEAFGSRPFVFTGIDPNSGEVLFSVPKVLANPPKGYLPDYPDMVYPFDIWDGTAKSMVYNLYAEPNNWGGAFNITAEGFIYTGNVLYSFKDGTLWRHGLETSFANFYGTQYNARIMLVSNPTPETPKVIDNLSLETNQTPILTYIRADSDNIQASDLVDFSWEIKEGKLYAAVLRDKLTPSATGLKPNALITGDRMRGITFKILFEFDVTNGPLQFRFANVGYQLSLGHTPQMQRR